MYHDISCRTESTRWDTYIGNTYLEAKISHKVYIVAGLKFGEKEDSVLVIFKEL